MKQFQTYVEKVNDLTQSLGLEGGLTPLVRLAAERALDGEASDHLRKSVPLEALRAAGAFFTGSALAARAWAPLLPTINHESVVVDPTCGAGNLLLPVVPRLIALTKSGASIASNIKGMDVSEHFVEATQARLALAVLRARGYHPGRDPGSTREEFEKSVRKGNFLLEGRGLLSGATHVALNPPYVTCDAGTSCSWASGGVNSAATFTAFCLENMPQSARMVAILPDVLRSGMRYRKWRDHIESIAVVDSVENIGQFDAFTDVHVFVLHLTKLASTPGFDAEACGVRIASLPDTNEGSGDVQPIVSDRFDVSVGTVVQFRHPKEGPNRRFATARGLPPWEEVSELPKRRFSGRCEEPPFVVVRRTSRPGEPHRARPTISTGETKVAVDNHLLVLHPKDGTIESCRALVEVLRDSATTSWLDERFRCRHLTVGALAKLPLTVDSKECDGDE